jgi:hypothetical protein
MPKIMGGNRETDKVDRKEGQRKKEAKIGMMHESDKF